MRVLYDVLRALWDSPLMRLIGGVLVIFAIGKAIVDPPSPDDIGPDGLSLYARTLGNVLRDSLDEEAAYLRGAGMPEEEIQKLRETGLEEILRIEKCVTETGKAGDCGVDRWRLRFVGCEE